jgi:hypothetical protein
MKKEFKKGDTVYYGTLKGEVTEQNNDVSDVSTYVNFENNESNYFTKDGREYEYTPVVLSHFPYELEMKRVEEVIEKDTVVWFKDCKDEYWRCGYYSHFENGKHYVFNFSQKSTETNDFMDWNIVTTQNPLI